MALLSVAPFWVRAVSQARETIRWSRERPLATLVGGERGPGFLEAAERIRAVVPPDGAYLVLANPYGPGAFVGHSFRQALLPRKPVLLQRFHDLAGKPSERLLATVVIDDRDDSGVVVTGEVPVFEPFDPGSLGTEDPSLAASVDDSSFDSMGRLRIRGWCQGEGAVRCDVAAVVVDGVSVPIQQISREPRPDVEASLPSIGPCPHAGYSVTLPLGVAAGPRISVRVAFRSADGRWRIYPERIVEREK